MFSASKLREDYIVIKTTRGLGEDPQPIKKSTTKILYLHRFCFLLDYGGNFGFHAVQFLPHTFFCGLVIQSTSDDEAVSKLVI